MCQISFAQSQLRESPPPSASSPRLHFCEGLRCLNTAPFIPSSADGRPVGGHSCCFQIGFLCPGLNIFGGYFSVRTHTCIYAEVCKRWVQSFQRFPKYSFQFMLPVAVREYYVPHILSSPMLSTVQAMLSLWLLLFSTFWCVCNGTSLSFSFPFLSWLLWSSPLACTWSLFGSLLS